MTPTDATDVAKSKLPAWAEPPAIEATRGEKFDVDAIRNVPGEVIPVDDMPSTPEPETEVEGFAEQPAEAYEDGEVLDGTVPPETDPESGEAIHTEVDGQPAVVHQRELRVVNVSIEELVHDLIKKDKKIANKQADVKRLKDQLKVMEDEREELIWEIKKHGGAEQLGLGVDA